ncbi:MAG: hypothetical protein JWQ43_44 [Glaciihabitans sp.]|nr:hypothetical protein [Glaciihabitans sp.]
MDIDTQTFLLANGVVVVISGFSFIVNTVLRGNDEVGRTWSVAFIAGILAALAYAVWEFAPSSWWILAVGNAAISLSVAALWSGTRQFNDRSPLLWVSFAASGVVGLSALVGGPDGGAWAGALEMFIAIATFAALSGAETLRGHFRQSLNARVLTVVFLAVSAYYLCRSIVFLVDTSEGEVFLQYFGTTTTTCVSMGLVILGAISMSVLVAGRGQRESMPATSGIPTIEGVLPWEMFRQHSSDWLLRAFRERDDLVLIVLDIANLDDMNTAFGRVYGDEAIRAVGRITVENSPSAAIVGHSSGKRFVVLTSAPSVGDAVIVAERLHTALVESPIDPVEGIRAVATCGLATTGRDGYDFEALYKTSLKALAAARDSGPGTIKLAGSGAPRTGY